MEMQPAAGRKRARPVVHDAQSRLRDNVLVLIHKTKAPLVAQRRRVELAYDAAWRAFCHVTVGDDELPWNALKTALWKLALAVHNDRTAKETVLRKIASSVLVSRGNARQQQLLVVWAWVGHSYAGDGGRLWGLGDVLLAVASVTESEDHTKESVVNEWLRVAIQFLLRRPEDPFVRRLTQGDRGASMSSCVVKYLVRIAFRETRLGATGSDVSLAIHNAVQLSTRDIAALAHDVLESICRGSHEGSKPLAIVYRAVCDRIQQHASDAALVTALRLFLRTETKAFLLAAVTSTSGVHERDDTVNQVLAIFQSCVSAADLVQLVRQVWIEAETETEKEIRSEHRDPIDVLAPWIALCAQRDRAFHLHALATAHDVAAEAIAASDAVALRHSLELAAATTVGTADDDGTIEDAGYSDWFRSHFAAADSHSLSAASTTSGCGRKSLSGNSVLVDSSRVCLRALPPPQSSGGSTASGHSHSMCTLVSTKRHLQFVCAFLLEFDRVKSQRRKAHHVFAHLSAMKTHQTLNGSAVGGLLSDFCSQTRARFSHLESQEQEVTARARRRRLASMGIAQTTPIATATPSQASLAASQYSSRARDAVEELLELHTQDDAALVRRVNQRKMFEAVLWKQEILPCCLDLAYWQQTGLTNPQCGTEEDTQEGQRQRRKRMSEVVSLVQLLAKHHAVGTLEYVVFVERAEAWFQSLQHPPATLARRVTHRSNEHNLAALRDAATAFSDSCVDLSKEHQLRTNYLSQTWEAVTQCFVAAFEGLTHELRTEQLEPMQVIYDCTVECLVKDAAAKRISVDHAVELYAKVWVALWSSETDMDATPEDRMHVMAAYCTFASQQATHKSSTSPLTGSERLVETALLGCLLGLLASVQVCETLARSASLAFCLGLEPTTNELLVDDLVAHLKQSSAYLSGFLLGFMTNPIEHAPQMLLQSMLTPPMRECLIWVGHHTSTWWSTDFAFEPADEIFEGGFDDPFWPFVQRAIHSASERYGWFRLTFSPGIFTTKGQWQVFMAMELTCCVTQILSEGHARIDMVAYINRQHEQIHTLMLTSTGSQAAGVRVVDVCIWIVQATLELAASSPPVASFALDALVLLLKDVWSTRLGEASSDLTPTVSIGLGFLMELTLQLVERFLVRRRAIVQYAVRCAKIMTEGARSTSPSFLVDISPVIIRQFIKQISSSADAFVVPNEWVSVAWCVVLKLQHTTAPYATVTEIPTAIIAHWAYEFPRFCRLLTVRKNGKVAHPSNASLLRTVQTCYEFFRTLNVRRLAPAPSIALVGISASQFIPASAADETLALHVQSLAWLIATDLIQTPAVEGSELSLTKALDFESSLAFHDVATRVLTALLEDLSIGHPDDVALELTEICQAAWLASITSQDTGSLQYQLLLIHVVAELAARHASVGRFLLRSSSELLNDSRRSLFVSLVLITCKEIEQLVKVLELNGSLWVNTFAEVACALADISDSNDNNTEQLAVCMVALVRHSEGFERQLVAVLSRLLSFAAALQIDLLDSNVVARIEKLFPTLRGQLARVPVLNLASAALADW